MSNLVSPIDTIDEAEARYMSCLSREKRANFMETVLRRIVRPGHGPDSLDYPAIPLLCLTSTISSRQCSVSSTKDPQMFNSALYGEVRLSSSDYDILSSRSGSTQDAPRAAEALKQRRDALIEVLSQLDHVKNELQQCRFIFTHNTVHSQC